MDKAHEIGSEFGHDGMVLDNGDGSILHRCQGYAMSVIWPRGYFHNPVVYVFADGSAIIIFDDCWDYRVAGCSNACPAEDKRCECGEV